MPPAKDLADSDTILESVKQQLADLNPAAQKVAERATIGAALGRLETYTTAIAGAGSLTALTHKVRTDVSNATQSLADFGPILSELYDLQQQLDALALAAPNKDSLARQPTCSLNWPRRWRDI